MNKIILASFSILFAAAILLPSAVTFAAPSTQKGRPSGGGGSTTTPLGIDISWPQCGKKLPNDPAFVVVGVNGGLATIPNDCLASQLAYANTKATGAIASQPKVQLYVNTANPGGMGTASWPTSNVDPVGNAAPNPFPEACDNSDSLACAWQYGWNRAVEDVNFWFTPAAQTAGISTDASKYIWWLDVELENTWKEGGTNFDFASNTAVLEGMTAYFESTGAEVGLYATKYQWDLIVGNAVSPSSNLAGLKNWRPGGASLSTAKSACTAVSLTTGGSVIMTQFISKNLDYNYTC